MPLRDLPPIVRLDLATVTLPDWHPEAATSPTCAVYGYAIGHPDGVIVFDTGVGTGNELIDELYDPDVQLLDQALIRAGLAPESVVAIVNSHLHFDHCGQNPLFHGSDVPVYVGRTEIDAVADDPLYTIAEWALAPEPQRQLVGDDTALLEGVTVLAAPGHTEGHLALLVEGGGERSVIAGQAVWSLSEFTDEVATPSNVADEELRTVAVDTMRRIKALDPVRVHFAHCDHYSQPA